MPIPFPAPPRPRQPQICVLSLDLSLLDISDKWNHAIHAPSCLASFTWQNVFKIHPLIYVACVGNSLFFTVV